MARWFLLAAAVGVIAVGIYFYLFEGSETIGGGSIVAALMFAAAAGHRSSWVRDPPAAAGG